MNPDQALTIYSDLHEDIQLLVPVLVFVGLALVTSVVIIIVGNIAKHIKEKIK